MSASVSVEVKAVRQALGRCLLAGVGLFLAAPGLAQDTGERGVEPWSEAVVSVTEFEPATALYPLVGETGRIEIMQIEGFTGHDHAEKASPPNLGILSIRYPIRDLSAYWADIAARGATIAYEAQGVAIAGLSTLDILAVRDPDGNLTEFYDNGD